MFSYVTVLISPAHRSEGRSELSLRRKTIDNTHVPKTLGQDMKDLRKLILSDNKLFFLPLWYSRTVSSS